MSVEAAIHDFVTEHQKAETAFLAEIVKVPSDNPPGDCDRPAETVAKLLEDLVSQSSGTKFRTRWSRPTA